VVEVEDKAFEDTLEDRLIALKQSHKYISQFITRDNPGESPGGQLLC
jgi:hypothetical protein